MRRVVLKLKFIYSEKTIQFCKISTLDFSYVVMVKTMVQIPQHFVAFSEYINFKVETLSFYLQTNIEAC